MTGKPNATPERMRNRAAHPEIRPGAASIALFGPGVHVAAATGQCISVNSAS